ncbi:MAG TPA: TadE/TadG family type IV pilus assembly protein [Candidatus Dormibacteraeota bacterium]|nr:TadE/TadG family type IV pilus assembly protein [Candidatus Dormibacteraeota bacterium]
MVEFAVALPLFMLLIAVCFSASSAMNSSIGLTGAARAGAIAAANDVSANANVALSTELADAVLAVNEEEGCGSCYTGATSQSGCAAGAGCVWITRTVGSRALQPIEVVHVVHPVLAVLPLVSRIAVQAQAGATP